MPQKLPEYKRQALQARRDALVEEYKAASAQLSRDLSEVNRTCLRRQVESLEHEIAEVEAQLRRTRSPAWAPTPPATSDEPSALRMARRALAILEVQAGAHTASTIPTHLQIDLEEKREQVKELEVRWRAGEL
jgi:hypothetical protein